MVQRPRDSAMGALAPFLVVLGAQWPVSEADSYCEDESFPWQVTHGAHEPGVRRCGFSFSDLDAQGGEMLENLSEKKLETQGADDLARPPRPPWPEPEVAPLLPTPSMPSRRKMKPEVDSEFQRRCERALPHMVWVPLSAIQLNLPAQEVAQVSKIILHLTRDNIAALVVIATLSVLGAIYLWKICTRRSCSCKLCAIYLWKICTRRSCSCKLCRNGYRSLDLLGSGGYGSVYLVERLPELHRFVSKKIPVREITEVDEYSREAKELIMLRHRHIVSYEEDFVHVEYGGLETKTYFIIIMEFCPEGDLKEKIEQDFLNFTEDWVRTIFAQLLQAVQYLHSKNVIHRDLKSQNVFLSEEGHVRLGDFGLCRHTHRCTGTSTLTHAGTDCYMAPEMLSSSRYGKPADMWSLGCILYELCTGQFMWELDGILGALVMADSHSVQKLVQKEIAPAVGNELKSLLKKLLHINPAMRPTATTCMRKKLFKRGFSLSKESFGQSLGEEGDNEICEVLSGLSGSGEGERLSTNEDSDSDGSEASFSPYSNLRRSDLPKLKRRKKKAKAQGRRS